MYVDDELGNSPKPGQPEKHRYFVDPDRSQASQTICLALLNVVGGFAWSEIWPMLSSEFSTPLARDRLVQRRPQWPRRMSQR